MRDRLLQVRGLLSPPGAASTQATSTLPGLKGAATTALPRGGAQPAGLPVMGAGLPPAGPPGAAQGDLSPAPRSGNRTAVLSVAVVAVVVMLGLAGAAAGAALFSSDGGGGESEDARSGQMVSSGTVTETTAPTTSPEATAPLSPDPSTTTSTSTTTTSPPATSPPATSPPATSPPATSPPLPGFTEGELLSTVDTYYQLWDVEAIDESYRYVSDDLKRQEGWSYDEYADFFEGITGASVAGPSDVDLGAGTARTTLVFGLVEGGGSVEDVTITFCPGPFGDPVICDYIVNSSERR